MSERSPNTIYLVDRCGELKEQITELQEQLDECRSRLLARMKTGQKIDGVLYCASYVAGSSTMQVDSKKVKANLPHAWKTNKWSSLVTRSPTVRFQRIRKVTRTKAA